MKISIITVTYNAGNVLERTMRSVAEQSFKDYEHLIIDGASKDDTLDIAGKFLVVTEFKDDKNNGYKKESKPNVAIHSERDTGIYHGMNRGLKYAKGEYIIFLNAGDTFADKDTLSKYALMIDKGYDIIYGDTDVVDNDGNFLRKRHLSAPKILTKESFKQGMLVCHQAFMVKREIAPKYSKKYRLSSDYDWTIRCMESTRPEKCVNLNNVVIKYLDNGATETHKLESLKERFKIMCVHYGTAGTIARHINFLFRAIKRKIKALK